MWRVLQPVAQHEALLMHCSRALVQQAVASTSIHVSSLAAHADQLWRTQQSSHYSTTSSSTSTSGSIPNVCSVGSSSATQSWHLQDQILLKGLTFHGYHGALPEVG
jgi:hypothetical protein